MNQWLKVKTAGLPRWAWISLFSGAVIIGLYLRSQNDEVEGEEEIEPADGGLDYYEGTDAAGGLGAAGLIGPAAGQVVPVEAPFVPDALTEVLTSQAQANVDSQNALAVLAQTALEREPNERVEIISEIPAESSAGLTGGGAPSRRPSHRPPGQRRKDQQRKKEAAKARRLSQKAKQARKRGNKKGAKKLAQRAKRASNRAKRLGGRRNKRARR